VITARVAGVDVFHNGVVTVPFGSTVASRQIQLGVMDPEGTHVTLGATVTNTSGHNGILASEWGTTVAAPSSTLNPFSGTFNFGSGSHLVTLTSNDGDDSSTLAFTINVEPAPPATLTVGSLTQEIGSTISVPVSLTWNGSQQIGGLSATVDFPAASLSFVSGGLDASQPSGFNASITAAAGVVTITITNPSGLDVLSQGVVANLTFQSASPTSTGSFSLVAGAFTASYAGTTTTTHSAALGNASTANGSVEIFSTPPTLSVSRGGFPVPTGSSFSVPYRASFASVGLQITSTDTTPGATLTVTTTMPGNAGTAGLVSAQFNGSSAAGNVSLSPSTGAFNTPGASFAFSIVASDGFASTTVTFTINVGPNADPVIAVTMGGGSVANGSTAMVDIGATVASLGLAIEVSDSDGDNVALTGTVSNLTTQGILNSEFSQSSIAAPYTRSPSTGSFGVPSVTHVVNLSATDGNGTPVTFSFTLQVRSNDAPAITASSSFGSISHNGSITVPFKTSVQALALVINVTDPDGDNVALSGVVSNLTNQGVLSSEFSSASTKAPYSLRPESGSFNLGGVTHTVTLTATDPYHTTVFSFNIVVGPNMAPTIRVTSNGSPVADAATVQVPFNSSLASLGLVVSVDDTEKDPTSLVTTISNVAGTQNISLAEWQRIASPVPYSRSPLSGRFNSEGATHLISLTANDGFGGTATRTLTVQVGLNSDPTLTVLSNGEPLAPSIGVFVGTTVASLGLSIAASDVDVDTTLTLAATLSGLTSQGVVLSEFQGSSASGSLTRNPTSGVFSVDGATHVLTLTATDGHGGNTVRTHTIVVSSQVRVATTSLPDTVIGQTLNVTLSAVQGTAPYSWSSDNLPTWLSLNASTGNLSGRPPRSLSAGTVSFTVRVSDSSTGLANSDSRQLSIKLSDPVLLDRTPIPAGSVPLPTAPTVTLAPTTDPIRNQVTAVDLPFPITFFGIVRNRIYISTNGFITFDDPGENSFPANTNLRNPVGPMNAVFLFWDSLEMPVGANSSITTGVATATSGNLPSSADGPVVNTGGQAFVVGFNSM
jgi:hypothetical protein